MKIALCAAAIVASTFIAASPSFGTPITYTESATASGSLDGISFTDATVFLSMTNDTTNVVASPPPFTIFTNSGTATVSVGGGPAVTFIDQDEVFSFPLEQRVGFSVALGGIIILDVNSASFATYEMTTSIGPIVGTSDINAGLSFATTGGAFVLTSVGDATFTATTTTIPEPSTWAMMALGFAGLGFLGYRKTRSDNALA